MMSFFLNSPGQGESKTAWPGMFCAGLMSMATRGLTVVHDHWRGMAVSLWRSGTDSIRAGRSRIGWAKGPLLLNVFAW